MRKYKNFAIIVVRNDKWIWGKPECKLPGSAWRIREVYTGDDIRLPPGTLIATGNGIVRVEDIGVEDFNGYRLWLVDPCVLGLAPTQLDYFVELLALGEKLNGERAL